MVEADGSEDVNDFLLRIRELGDRRDKEDDERTRKLEEEIMQGRKERQARRAERARSISPTKDSPSNPQTPPTGYAIAEPLYFSKLTAQSMDPARGSPSPGPDLSMEEQGGGGKAGSASAKLNSTTNKDVQGTSPRPVASVSASSPVSSSQLSRAGTLSWQQRPGSRGSTDSKTRPLSLVAAQNRTLGQSKDATKSPVTEDIDLSQDQIAQSLGAKDPTWFRQTPDRSQGSAALRKSETAKNSDTESQSGVRLPGLSKQSPMEPQNFRAHSERPQSPSAREREPAEEHDSKSESTSPGTGLSSAFPTINSQRLEPPSGTSSLKWGSVSSSRAPAMSPSQGRISPERMQRPPSPTKGSGGFVQSAMLKRTESVNKRWSAQASQGMSRGNSIASNRGGFEGSRDAIQGVTLPLQSRKSTYSRDPSPLASSRPGSSHSTDLLANNGFVKPDLPEHARMSQDLATESQRSSTESLDKIIPQSPSKRWSPSKNPSWLESALSKTDSPKLKPAAPPQQPSWMTDINRAKASRGSVDLGKSTSFQEVSVGGLLRAPPMGATPKSPSLNDVSMASPPATAKPITSNTAGKSNGSDSNPTNPAATSNTDRPEYLMHNITKDASIKISKSPVFDVKGQSGSGSPKPTSTASSSGSPASTKSKPITPPKKDFRSSLQSRKPPAQNAESTEPEFKNVFGKLKRTETKNYVAPDELKSNILRGKAGLAVTDGPKKSERMDGFKQSILKKKEEMKAGGTVADAVRKPSGSSVDKTSDSNVPEAIAKRRALGSGSSSIDKPSNPPLPEAMAKRRGLGVGSSSIDKTSDSSVPEAIAKRRALGRSGSSQSSTIATPETEPRSPAVTPRQVSAMKKPKVELPEQKFSAPAIESTLPSITPRQASVGQKPKVDAPEKKSSAPGRMQRESTSGGKLADRFVPGLAGILSRGPMPVSGAPARAMTASPTESKEEDQALATKESGQASSGTQLTHATKGRARGPKRRLPASLKPDDTPITPAEATAKTPNLPAHIEKVTHVRDASSADVQPLAKVSSSPLPNITDRYNNKAQTLSPPHQNQSSKSLNGDESKPQPIDGSSKLKERLSPKPKPATPIKSSPAIIREPTPRKPSTSVESPRNVTSPTSPINVKPRVVSPTKETIIEPERRVNENVESVLRAAAQWDSSSKPSPQRPQGPKSPIKLPTRKDEEDAMKQAGLTESKAQKPIGLGIRSLSDEDTRILDTPTSSRTLPSLPQKSPRSPPLPAKKPDSILNRIISNGALPTPPQEASASPLPVFTEAAHLLKEFFDDVSIPKSKVDVDAQAVLVSRPSFEKEGKIKTLRKQIFELTPDGKKNPVPSQQEHILFEENMYLCTHVFGSVPSGKRTTEVYLWCGDGVSSSAIEDAQLFSRNTAKEAGGKLIVLNQGKESSNFFEALGGIVITRRGSNSSGAAATYMLCGRRHMGQIAFDEVPLSANSLCSGFPYIVSATSGRLYLWKGKGSGADELGCARLIGMDLGLTGEIEEIDEGAEPAVFWRAFPSGNQKRQTTEAGHWHLKATCDKYATRLFTVELESPPKSAGLALGFGWGRRGSAPNVDDPTDCIIKEISPYAQADLGGRGVYVLDAFFEVWVIVGGRATSKFPTFRAALLFAQEYGILAASMEDRPFVPAGGVVLQGAPAGVTNAFRKWKEDGKKEGVITLNDALEAAGCDRG
ncbi:hypothetical protein MMC30_004335 [Trapelia coarctata]|nr:hypothetical protein [Trapelia coarctata]